MIRIYDKNELLFTSLGLGSLDDALAAVVQTNLNGTYEIELEYPLSGRHFDKLVHRNIIFCKPNMYEQAQPFRIYSISKPIDGVITVNAEHISYDALGTTVLPKRNEDGTIKSFGDKVTNEGKDGYFLDTIIRDINESNVLFGKNKSYFTIVRHPSKENIFVEGGYSIPAPMNLRSIVAGTEVSLLEKVKGEYVFDRFNIILMNKRGQDRGVTIRYGKNMTDLEHESETNNVFTAIFPFYSKAYSETQSTTKPVFQEAYITKNGNEYITPLRADWLSIELMDANKGIGGISLKPVVEVMKVIVDGIEDLVERYAPVIVKTPNDPDNPSINFYNKIYVFKKNTVELGNLVNAYVSQKTINDDGDEIVLEIKANFDDVEPLIPSFGKIYVIKSEDSQHYNRKLIYDKYAFVTYSSDGFYVEAKDATLVESLKDLKPLPTYPISWDEVESKWIEDHVNGWIYVEPKKPNAGTISVEKYVYVDLLNFSLPENSETLLEDGLIYINQTLKDMAVQRVLTLDMTDMIDDIQGLEPNDVRDTHVFNKAEQYLKDNDLTKIKESLKISFTKLSDSEEYSHLRQLEVVELGDEINVVYDELGVNSKHRVISVSYNVLTDSYDEIELGDTISKVTNSIVSVGDGISNLKNDEDYSKKSYVVNFVAENLEAINAQIKTAIIETLQASNVNISGLLTASSATIDQLVSEMLVTKNAKISELLEAGSLRVKGHITAISGEIGGSKIQDGKLIVSTEISIVNSSQETKFIVNQNGEVIANSIRIEGGMISIGGTEGNPNFKVNEQGEVIAKDIRIEGGEISIGGTSEDPNFKVNEQGEVIAKDIRIEGGKISIGGTEGNPNFEVTEEGNVRIQGLGSININGQFVVNEAGYVEATKVNSIDVYATNIKTNEIIIDNAVKFGEDGKVEIKRQSEMESESQILQFESYIYSRSYNPLLDITTFRVYVQEKTSKVLWIQRTFDITLFYKINFESYSVNSTVTVPNGQYTNYVDILVEGSADALSGSSGSAVFPQWVTENRNLGLAKKLVAIIDGITYDLAGSGAGNYVGVKIFRQINQPLEEDVRDGDFWYEQDPPENI